MKVAVCALVLLVGCRSFIDNQAASSTYRILESSFAASRRQADVELARTALPGGIVQLEAFALAYPGHREFRTLHADALCDYTVAFVFDDWEDAKLGDRAAEQARLATRLATLLPECVEANLALLPAAWRTARASGAGAWLGLIPRATAADVPALRWIATADAVAVALEPLRNLDKLPGITAALDRCALLAPGARDAGAEILLGTLTAARPSFLGGADGAALFQRARQAAGPGVLMVDVMFARGTAVARRDRTLFETTLHQVLGADLTRWPDHRLANELAQLKARRYLAAEDALLPR